MKLGEDIKVDITTRVETEVSGGVEVKLDECAQAEPTDDSRDDFNARQVQLVKYITVLFAKLD